jgi:hypothetical protein
MRLARVEATLAQARADVADPRQSMAMADDKAAVQRAEGLCTSLGASRPAGSRMA